MTVNTEAINQINDMKQLREAVDQIDSELIELFRLRFACMDAAARIKADRNSVRDEKRKAEVLNNAKSLAEKARIPVPAMAAIWEMLVETSISYELQKWDQIRK